MVIARAQEVSRDYFKRIRREISGVKWQTTFSLSCSLSSLSLSLSHLRVFTFLKSFALPVPTLNRFLQTHKCIYVRKSTCVSFQTVIPCSYFVRHLFVIFECQQVILVRYLFSYVPVTFKILVVSKTLSKHITSESVAIVLPTCNSFVSYFFNTFAFDK